MKEGRCTPGDVGSAGVQSIDVGLPQDGTGFTIVPGIRGVPQLVKLKEGVGHWHGNQQNRW